MPEQPIRITGHVEQIDEDEVVLAMEARQEERALVRNASARVRRTA